MKPHLPTCLTLLACLMLSGCSGSEDENVMPVPDTPEEAADQVTEVFQSAPPQIQQAVVVASTGLREGNYEQAVVSLQTIRQHEGLTLDQGMAVHHSMVALEGELIRAAQAGDPKARQAYDLLKKMKRD